MTGRRNDTGRPARALAGMLCAALLSSGCVQFGSRTVQGARFDYNEAIAHTMNEQQLLNLVRLRYRDTPMFLEVGSVNTQYSFSGNAAISSTLQVDGNPGNNEYGAGVGIGYTESPTISYAPLQGERFVTQLLSPVPLRALMLLTTSGGWSVERIFRTCVQRANGVLNAPSASGPTPDYVPRFREFQEVARLMRRLQIARAIDAERRVVAGAGDGAQEQSVVVLRFDRVPGLETDRDRLLSMLGLDPDVDTIELTAERLDAAPNQLVLVTRSLLGVMYYLSQAVEVPDEHLAAGWANVPHDENGNAFDWSEVTGDLFRVRSSPTAPRDAFVRVPYRGAWFYIADDDLQSKSTFSLLNQLFYLRAGEVDLPSPALTLSVN